MSKKILDEIKKFQESLPESFKAIVEIDSKKIFLENISELDENILIIEGKEIQSQVDLKFFVSKSNLNFILYAIKSAKSDVQSKNKIHSVSMNLY